MEYIHLIKLGKSHLRRARLNQSERHGLCRISTTLVSIHPHNNLTFICRRIINLKSYFLLMMRVT